MAISSGKIGRVWAEGFNSELGIETCVVLILGAGVGISPYSFCYIRLKASASFITVGDELNWKGDNVWLESRLFENIIELERIGPSFVKYDTSKSFMISEWTSLE